MDDAMTQRAMNIAKMEDGTYHPGALTALAALNNSFGEEAIGLVESRGMSFMDVWDLYVECNRDANAMYLELQEEPI